MKISSLFKAAGIDIEKITVEIDRNAIGDKLYIYRYGEHYLRIVVKYDKVVLYGQSAKWSAVTKVLYQHNIKGKSFRNDIKQHRE